MSEKDDGGPAFPRPPARIEYSGESYDAQEGMSLRDYFAARAMQGYRAGTYGTVDERTVAVWAYRDADAMIAERKK